jgi:hypothetical protein
MKVKCIGDASSSWLNKGKMVRKHWWSKKSYATMKGPKKDDILTVEKEFWCEGVKFYLFIEWPGIFGYNSEFFVPLEESFEAVSFKEVIKEKQVSVN